MTATVRRWLLVAAVAGAGVVAGCGAEEDRARPADETGAPVSGTKGGTLTVLWTDDVDFIDPGQTYYTPGYMVAYATQRPLYSWKPGESEVAVPDLAEAQPEVTDGGRTVTVRIRSGVRFSPPVDREVTSADVKYAIERGFFNTVNTGYMGAYFGDIAGAEVGAEPGTEIEGIETPDDRTIVFRLKRATGGVLAGALSLTVTAPVPEEYAREYDRESPSTYGEHQVATGPYMIESDGQGNTVGYEAGQRIHLVRNPRWDAATDYKPAYVDEIVMPQGNDDTTVASRRIIEGESMISGDYSPDPSVLKQLTTSNPELLTLVPSGSLRFISMNTTVEPFDDPDVRRAVVAGFDRRALLLTRGGTVVGDMPTHILPPGVPGFEEAGGMEGPGFDFLAAPEGDAELAAEYFRRAGYASGRYEGDEELLMVGTSDGVAQNTAEVAKENFERLGFKVRLRLVTQDAMYTRFCQVPDADVAICPNVGWVKDFNDAQTFLDPTFNGGNIVPQSNSNFSELDVPEINRAMDEAALLSDAGERARAWAEIDRMVTQQAPVIPYIWDKQPLIASPNVNAVPNDTIAQWDLAWTSIE